MSSADEKSICTGIAGMDVMDVHNSATPFQKIMHFFQKAAGRGIFGA
jgi:hypothetical protein